MNLLWEKNPIRMHKVKTKCSETMSESTKKSFRETDIKQ